MNYLEGINSNFDYSSFKTLIFRGTELQSRLNPDFSQFFNLLINVQYLAKHSFSSGGSTSSAIGIIWYSPFDNWNASDIVEFNIHELCHQTLFLDEAVYGHFKGNAFTSDIKVTSPIRNEKRKIRLSFHAAIVATEVLLAKSKYHNELPNTTVHGLTEDLIISTRNALLEILELETLLTRRGKLLLELCLQKINSLFH